MNISSILVQTKPEHLDSTKKTLEKSELCDVFFTDKSGKIVVTIEGEDVKVETEKLKQIQNLPNVISAQMSYTYSDEDFNKNEIKGKIDV